MTPIRVRAEQTTVDWERGSEFDVERTHFVDRLIANGGLTVLDRTSEPTQESDALGIDPGLPFVPDGGTPPEDVTNAAEGDEKPAVRRRRGVKTDDA
ncbi:hypothetical protein A5N78_04490 [Prescottella equi]|nr:hypothetical protein A5N78_04490 [Prescottella equi]ORM17752.1 hypothetical protein A5N70_11065 [Prescottella equi]